MRYRTLATRHPDPELLDTSVTFDDVSEAAGWIWDKAEAGYLYVSIYEETESRFVIAADLAEKKLDLGAYSVPL